MTSTMCILRAASLWYPIMLTQMQGHLSEAKAAQLLGLNIDEYRDVKQAAIDAVLLLVKSLPSPLNSLLDVIRDRPELLEQIFSPSNSSSTAGQ